MSANVRKIFDILGEYACMILMLTTLKVCGVCVQPVSRSAADVTAGEPSGSTTLNDGEKSETQSLHWPEF